MLKNKVFKSFTLAEVFVAMVVIATIGSVCIAFLKNRHNYSREYMYYSTYMNLVKVVDTILDEGNSNYTELGTCDGHKCMKFKSDADLCTALRGKLNHNFGASGCVGKLANGIEFINNSGTYTTVLNNLTTIGKLDSKKSYTLVVDVDGQGNNTKDTLFYDIMPFYITEDGKVIPEWGEASGLRGYNGGSYDAGGNASLMSFDVVYTSGNDNKLLILDNGRNVSFAQAACLAGYVSGSYCNIGTDGATVDKSNTCTGTTDCRIRLVKKLKWSK